MKALFIKELDKLYGPGGPNKDMHERAEEMERMREHVFKENDKNRDGLIDYQEFMLEAKKASFNQDEGNTCLRHIIEKYENVQKYIGSKKIRGCNNYFAWQTVRYSQKSCKSNYTF